MIFSEKALLGFVSAFLTSALWPNLPTISLIGFMLFVLILGVWYKIVENYKPDLVSGSPVKALFKGGFLNGVICGALWASLCAYYYTSWQLDHSFLNANIVVEGTVTSVASPTMKQGDSQVFTFELDKLGRHKAFFSPSVRISWFAPNIDIQQGHRLRLFVRLKAPVALANRHGFNYQKWLVSKNIVATAYVKQSPSNHLIDASVTVRQTLINRLYQQSLANTKWISALMYGDRSNLTPDDWLLMQDTGTAHLFAISGMHLGIVFGLSLLVCNVLFSVSLLLKKHRQLNRKVFNLVICSGLCFFYAWLSGFEIPVMRALISLLLVSLLTVFGKHWRLRALILSLLSIFFLLFPFAHLGVSFWFSFIAVGLIWLFVWRFPIQARASKWQVVKYTLCLQAYLSIATLPMIMMVFQSLPLISLVANLVIIPVITFVLVPLCLVAAFCSVFALPANTILTVIDTSFTYLLALLNAFNRIPAINVNLANIPGPYLCLLLGIVLLMFLPSWHRKAYTLSSICICTLLWQTQNIITSSIRQSPWYVYVFDVGQGTSVVIESNGRYIIYDTGAKFRGDFSMAKAVLIPFFESKGMPYIDKLVLSHLDNDHAGGQQDILNVMQVGQVIQPSNGCLAGTQQFWQDLNITFLWPLTKQSGDDNNHSCVIKIAGQGHSILLTGDIEQTAEGLLVNQYKKQNTLSANIILAPHHGSKTSSTANFVSAVAPKYVVFSAGYNNRWGFPDADVVKRYQKYTPNFYNTGQDGQITFTIKNDGISAARYRRDEMQRWYFRTY